MSDTATPVLFTDPTALPDDARQVWEQLIGLTGQREFNREAVRPGATMPPLRSQAWELSEQLLRVYPGFLNNRMLRANLFLVQQQLPEAEQEARFLLQHAPCSQLAHGLLAQLLVLRGGLEEARQLHQEAAARCPDLGAFGGPALYLTGEARYEYPEEAIAVWSAHLQQEPADAAIAQALAELYLELDELEKAEAVLATAVQSRPDHLELRLLYGSLLAENGDLANARTHFEHIHLADPYNGRARMHLARLWSEVGDLGKALKLLREGMAENTGDPDYNLLLGLVAMAEEQRDIAGTAFVRYLALDPDDEEGVQEAEEALRNLGLWHEKNVHLQFLLADRALNAGEGLKAVKHLSNIQQTGVDTRQLYLKMAEAHHAMGLLDDPLNFLLLAKTKKRRTFESQAAEDPTDRRLDILMLSLLLQAEYPREEALPKLETHKDFAKIGNDEPESYFLTLADCWARVGDLPRAREALLIAIDRNPLDALAWMELATLHEAADDPAAAVRTWRQVWELTGPDPDVAQHLSANYEALGALPWAAYFAERALALAVEDDEATDDDELGDLDTDDESGKN